MSNYHPQQQHPPQPHTAKHAPGGGGGMTTEMV